MKKTVFTLFSTSALVAAFSLPAHANDTAAPAKLKLCVGCHAADGNSVVPTFPKLAGQHAKYLEKQLKDFRGGFRRDSMMQNFAQKLSDKDIKALANYYSQQKAK